MKPPPPPPPSPNTYTSTSTSTSKKRLFPCKGSKFMGHEIFEIPPQFFWSSKMHKQKQVIPHDVIDIDKGGDSADVMFIDGKVHTRNKLRSNKGKKIKDVSDGYGGHQAKSTLILCRRMNGSRGKAKIWTFIWAFEAQNLEIILD